MYEYESAPQFYSCDSNRSSSFELVTQEFFHQVASKVYKGNRNTRVRRRVERNLTTTITHPSSQCHTITNNTISRHTHAHTDNKKYKIVTVTPT